MSESNPLQDLLFLTSTTGQSIFNNIDPKYWGDTMKLAKICEQQGVPVESRRFICEYAGIKQKIDAKFPSKKGLLCDHFALAQASREPLAKYKASKIQEAERVADLGCGMGGDSLYLPNNCDVLGVDRDLRRCFMFLHNLHKQSHQVQAICMDLTHWRGANWGTILLDPARKKNRTAKAVLEEMEPSWALMQQMISKNPHALIKLSPMIDHHHLPIAGDIEFLGDAKECSEMLLLTGKYQSGRAIVRCVLAEQGVYLEEQKSILQSLHPAQKELSQYLVEPHPVVIRSGLYKKLALEHNMHQFNPDIPYLSTSHKLLGEWWDLYQIMDVFPYKVKKVQQILNENDVGRLTIKKRGVAVLPEVEHKKFKLRGSKEWMLILFPQGKSIMAALALPCKQ
jgi:hypothetical protein